MKKLIASFLIAAVAGALAQTAQARDCGWSTAGKVFTGFVAGAAIVSALQPQPVYAYSSPTVVYAPPPPVVYAPPRVVMVPAPVVYAPRPVVVYSAPVCVRPAPLVRVHWGYGFGHRHFRERGCW